MLGFPEMRKDPEILKMIPTHPLESASVGKAEVCLTFVSIWVYPSLEEESKYRIASRVKGRKEVIETSQQGRELSLRKGVVSEARCYGS